MKESNASSQHNGDGKTSTSRKRSRSPDPLLPNTITTGEHGSGIKKITLLQKNELNSFLDTFHTYKAVFLPQILKNGVSSTCTQNEGQRISWDKLMNLFGELNEDDKASWCIENSGGKNKTEENTSPNEFLNPHEKPVNRNQNQEKNAAQNDNHARGYCSFLVQHDAEVKKNTIERLPLSELPFSGDKEKFVWKYGPSIWFFFGRNPKRSADNTANKDLQGRPEHTDSVSHDGTWHYQLSGRKIWYLRPTAQLLKHFEEVGGKQMAGEWSKASSSSNSIKIECKEGDVLVVNTRLWWHRTVIPTQNEPSVSYARDFFLNMIKDGNHQVIPASNNIDNRSSEKSSDNNDDACGGMTNVDGLYASDDIEVGTVIFTEHDMPDCELHRSSNNPNCDVVELEDGTSAVVSTRDIATGEFFCVPESDDEEEEEEMQEEEE
mmetsp:Transcript_22835/g.35227  ORF Transcript_22835/g.35227 Transcript_22835/m.35227 type:complete len:435 (+) Transcript_22835:50-1354(+)|eukprot:CAMPEP_0195301504 /NCGR_PEP_ID=MMETSP0707-20130614/29399_1 /TAXON_ID=33640 /ORGANISM="Asterionellopsis glacialis, Strain CCMP134" /LENGTH=434 /DNA_ID=CAMNT_0040364463 /DNA_START=52 /DNA_END=1356 /DNA_ORIENTATION=+